MVEHDDDGVEACLAARDRDAFRPLLGELHRREVAHDRRYAGLILVGNRAETRVDRPRARWEDLVLPDELGLELRRTVEEFFAAGPLYRRHELPHRRGILLAGPPGNGKTSILRAIGSTLGLPVVVATLEDPNGAHNTRRAFERAAALAPAVLCFEDLDALVGDGPGLSQFLNLLDGLAPREGLLVLATTNHPDAIDPAITKRPSRFDRVFVVPNPGLAQRRAFLEKLLGGAAPLGEADRLAEATGGYSMAFLEELVLQARLNAVRRGDQALTPADLEAALTATREHLRVADCGIEDRGPIGFSA